jgi:nicotinamidase-related amidase
MTREFPTKIDWHSPVISPWFLPLPRLQLRAEKCALLIIDMQKYVTDPSLGYGPIMNRKSPELAAYYYGRLDEVVVPTIKRLIDHFRDRNLRVLFTRVGPQLQDGSDLIRRRQTRDLDQMKHEESLTLWPVGSPEHDIIDTLKPRRGEYIFDKNSSSAFNSTAMHQILSNMGIEDLIVTGVATDMCVESTARDAADRGFNVFIIEDGTCSFEEIAHISSLYNLAKTYGMVLASNELLSQLMVAG